MNSLRHDRRRREMKDTATAQSRAGWTLALQGPALGRFSTGMEKTGPSVDKDEEG
jgi:hypothetical protein